MKASSRAWVGTMIPACALALILNLTGCPPDGDPPPKVKPNYEYVDGTYMRRTKTPTGWVVYSSNGACFVHDPKHEWLTQQPVEEPEAPERCECGRER